jgi:hypothetical protein
MLKLKKSTALFLFGIVLSSLIRYFFIVNGRDIADVSLLHQIARLFLSGENPYLSSQGIYVYPPLAVFIQGLALAISDYSNIPFHQIFKVFPNIADLVAAALIYKILLIKKATPGKAVGWSLFYLLNPLTIIISAIHGQVDSITSMFLLGSLYYLLCHRKSIVKSAILLGLAIAVKPNPLVLAPFLLFSREVGSKNMWKYFLMSALPLAIFSIPFLSGGVLGLTKATFGYVGAYDFGYAGVIRGLNYFTNASIWLPSSSVWLFWSKIVYFIALLFLFIRFLKSRELLKGVLLSCLLFLTLYFGISAQYLIWVIPLAIIIRDKMVIYFTLIASLAFAGFYLFFGPDILFGELGNFAAFQSKYMSLYIVGNFLLSGFLVFWTIRLTKKHLG